MSEFEYMRFALKTAPSTEPVTETEFKAQRRITGTDEDTYLGNLITRARVFTEQFVGPIISQSWYGYLDDWPQGDTIIITKPRVSTLTSITYLIEGDAVATTFSSLYYSTDFVSFFPRVRLKDGYEWPTDDLEVLNPITFTLTAGWTAAANVPDDLKQAILFLASWMHQNRESGEAPKVFWDMISRYRTWI